MIKTWRDKVKKIAEPWIAYLDHYDDKINSWYQTMQNAFQYIDQNYYRENGLGFSDLEYLIFRGLQNPEVRKKINEDYDYFIVDEFQDTSFVQFDILDALIGKDYKRLFCVGDIKQAIYGFRGGELGVFFECGKRIPRKLFLTNNYRCCPNIINFNNFFFDNLFAKGIGFEGNPQQKVPVSYQTVPEAVDHPSVGHLLKISVAVEGDEDKSLSSDQINFLEAESILQQLMNLNRDYPTDDKAILYSKLAPTAFLLPLLLENEISFSAQIKVPFKEDPLLGILMVLLESRLSEKVSPRYVDLMMECYLKFLDIPSTNWQSHFAHDFYEDGKLWGIGYAFRRMLYRLKINNSNHSNNLKQIDAIINLTRGEISGIWQKLQIWGKRNYSIEFQYGDNPNNIKIMTTHASKGLEFDHVIIGGIHTNGRKNEDHSYFGNFPGSFRWKDHSSRIKPYKTPFYIWESEFNKHKDFAEGKRLFYVACTRAKKSLTWVEFSFSGKGYKSHGNSWINGFLSWQNDNDADHFPILEHINQHATKVANNNTLSEEELFKLENRPPFFHKDSLGLASNKESKSNTDLKLWAEMSVTRLASLQQCPRKFMFLNICRFTSEEMSLLKGGDTLVKQHDDFLKEEKYLEENYPISSASRGTHLHERISKMLLGEEIDSLEDENDKIIIDWIIEKIDKYPNHLKISEQEIKFSFKGQMLVGIPDLLLLEANSNPSCEIWDFKTGQRGEEKEKNYWLQLYLYAHALWSNAVSQNQPIHLVLVFLDTQEMVRIKARKEFVNSQLNELWKKLGSFDQVKGKHCNYCDYQILCASKN